MTIDKIKFEKVVAEALAKVEGNKRWVNAINRAADAILNGKWVITELQHCIAVTTESDKTYYANNKMCQCEAFFKAFPCKHIAGHRLIELYREAEAAEEAARRCDVIIADIKAIADERAHVIADIRARWPKDVNLADELTRRFHRNTLEALSIDFLAAIAATL